MVHTPEIYFFSLFVPRLLTPLLFDPLTVCPAAVQPCFTTLEAAASTESGGRCPPTQLLISALFAPSFPTYLTLQIAWIASPASPLLCTNLSVPATQWSLVSQ